MKKILVCYDFSKNSEKALEVAVSWAKKFGSSIDLVYVDDKLVHAGLYADIVIPSFEEGAYEIRHELFSEKVAILKGKHEVDNIVINGHLLFGNPISEILNFSHEKSIDFIVLGSKGVNFFSKFNIGSFAWSLITTTKLPLLCVKLKMINEPTSVLYAAELDKKEQRSLEILKNVVDAFSPHLEIGHIIAPDTQLALGYEVNSSKIYNQLKLKMELAHQKALYGVNDIIKQWNFSDASTFVDDVVHENKAKKLLEYVEKTGVDLFVLGSHSKSFWDRVCIGSVSEYVLRRCSKSFLIIPNKEV